MTMVGIYLSGTGNTKHCVEKLTALLDESAKTLPMESPEALTAIRDNDFIILGYATKFSNIPVMVRDFINDNAEVFCGKKVFILVTMGLFAGDVSGIGSRLLRKAGAKVVGATQLKMPDSVADSKALKKSAQRNHDIIIKADKAIEKMAKGMKNGHYPHRGLHIVSNICGFWCQRAWFLSKSADYCNTVKISDACVGCGLCVKDCPMQNLVMKDKKPQQSGKCTLCYRCVSHCPKEAITIIGKEVIEQVRYDKYIK